MLILILLLVGCQFNMIEIMNARESNEHHHFVGADWTTIIATEMLRPDIVKIWYAILYYNVTCYANNTTTNTNTNSTITI